ncbi:MAG TPA: HAD-IB family hydrolase [Acidimicrobiales bacterium]|nr:HAD-IB family hydrolase [Acidimicrobiales bacterium]
MSGAAFFDLDRTLLTGSSTPTINEALFEAGLASRRGAPGQELFMAGYRIFGESAPSMLLARAAALTARGKRVDQVRAAAETAAERLERDVVPYAHPLIEWHRAEGRKVVLATTTPEGLVRPLAERLGFDDVVATRWATKVDAEGVERYTGGVDGGFVWALGKLLAARRWATANGVDLRESWAYSDSVYDLPLLEAVGNPTAVNPDLRLYAAAKAQRWPVVHLDAPAGVPKLFGVELLDLLGALPPRAAFPYARFDVAGLGHIPRRGPVLLVANHRSYFDPMVLARVALDAGRRPRFLGKKEVVDAPVVGQLARFTGAVRVDRDGDARLAYEEALQALRCGELVVILPQGTIPRGEAFFDPKLQGRSGAARLAAATGAPVVPVGIWGSEAVWPRSSRLPTVTKLLDPPTVRVRVGAPVDGLVGDDPHADTERILEAISAQLPDEAHLARIPTPDELARTVPATVR